MFSYNINTMNNILYDNQQVIPTNKNYEDILNESREIPEVLTDDKFVMNCFGVDVFEQNGELISEYDYDKTL